MFFQEDIPTIKLLHEGAREVLRTNYADRKRSLQRETIVCITCFHDAALLPSGGAYCQECQCLIDKNGNKLPAIVCAECGQETLTPNTEEMAFCNYCRFYVDKMGREIILE